jgi:hypothetical protein
MSKSAETLRVVIPLTFRKKNGRPKILPPEDVMPFPERRQDPHILRAIGRSWGWRRKIEAGTAPTIRDIAEIEKISASLVARYLRLAYLAPEVMEALLVERRVPAVRVLDLLKIAERHWAEQMAAVFGEG